MVDIVISEFMNESIIDTVFADYDVLFDPELVDKQEKLLAAVAEARALIIRNRTQVRDRLLDTASRLQVVGRLGVGLDNIDVQACEARGIKVCPATGANDLSVAEYVVTATLLLLRRAWYAGSEVIAGDWPRMDLIGREMSGKRMGLVGYGAIARETSTRVRALGMEVCAYDPYLADDDPRWSGADKVELDELLSTADVISLHVPLTDETKHLIDAGALKRMKKNAIIINAARGGIVDEQALMTALTTNHLGGAALDVFEAEPVDAKYGGLFKDVPNLILTPHIAGVTEESNVRVSQVTAENVLKHLS